MNFTELFHTFLGRSYQDEALCHPFLSSVEVLVDVKIV